MMRKVLNRGLGKGWMVLAVAGASLLAGCASKGLMESDAKGLSDSFSVSTDYESVYRRAQQYVRVCHVQRPHRYVEYASIRDGDQSPDDSIFGLFDTQRANEQQKYKDMGRIRVFKVGEAAKVLELIEARGESVSPVSTRVTVSVLGTDIWDKAELAAARQSIETATPVCRPLE